MSRRLLPSLALMLVLFAGCTLTNPTASPSVSPSASPSGLDRFQGTFLDVFDTGTQVILYDTSEESATATVNAIHEELLQYHRLYDIYNDYEGVANIKTINDNAGIAPVKVDSRIIDLLLFAKDAHALTGGKVNVALGSVLRIWHDYRENGIESPETAELPPMDALVEASKHTDISGVVIDEAASTVYLNDAALRLDVGAIAKGYAAQRVTDDLKATGVTSLLLSVGGNVCSIGVRGDGTTWKVAVQSPDLQGSLCTLNISGQTLVTSGTYQRYYTVDGKRYHHIIDPDTLMPATRFESVSILCENSGAADALSTAVFNMSLDDGMALIENTEGAEAIWVEADGTQTKTSGFDALVVEE